MPQLGSVSIAHYTGSEESHDLFFDTFTLEKDTDEVVQTDYILAVVFLELGCQLFILVLILGLGQLLMNLFGSLIESAI